MALNRHEANKFRVLCLARLQLEGGFVLWPRPLPSDSVSSRASHPTLFYGSSRLPRAFAALAANRSRAKGTYQKAPTYNSDNDCKTSSLEDLLFAIEVPGTT